MPYPLNNQTTAFAYSAAPTFDTPPVRAASAQVNNAAVYYRVTTSVDGVPGAVYPERYLIPGKWTFEEGLDWRNGELLVKMEFRSAVSGTDAQVSAS